MTLSKFYVNIEPPQSKKVLWIKPLLDGFAIYIWFKDKWQLLKILGDNGTPIIWDDITLDFYTKDEIDSKLADILGLDAEGIAELKALVEDKDFLTGILPELKKKANASDVYTKTETYNKTEVDNFLSQQYVSVTATAQTTAVTDLLPTTGNAGTIYRVGNWDGSQFDASVYSEYAWNGSQYIHLSTKTRVGEVFDISAYHATGGVLAKYADLAAALDSNNGGGVPQSLQRGGMEVKYVCTYDNKYVQYRLMTQTFSTTESDWQGVDNEPTPGSENLVKSGGVNSAVSYIYKKPETITFISGIYDTNGNITNLTNRVSTMLLPKGTIVTLKSGYVFVSEQFFNNDGTFNHRKLIGGTRYATDANNVRFGVKNSDGSSNISPDENITDSVIVSSGILQDFQEDLFGYSKEIAFIQGVWDISGRYSDDNKRVSSMLLPISTNIVLKDGYVFVSEQFFESDGTTFNHRDLISGTSYITTANNVRLCVKKSDNSIINPDDNIADSILPGIIPEIQGQFVESYADVAPYMAGIYDSNGTITSTTTRISSNYLKPGVRVALSNSAYTFVSIQYFNKDNKSFISRELLSSSISEYTVPSTDYLVRIGIKHTDGSTITTDESPLNVIQSTLANRVSGLEERVTELEDIPVLLSSPQIYISQSTENEQRIDNLETDGRTRLENLYKLYDDLVDSYPSIFSKKTSIGKDESNTYDINYYCICDNISSSFFKKRLLFTVGVHGWSEPIATRALYDCVVDILSSNEQWALYLKANYIIDVVPMINPWGLMNSTSVNVNGVNLNRDYSNENKQQETINMIGLITELLPKNLVGVVDLHTFDGAGNNVTFTSNASYTDWNYYQKLTSIIRSALQQTLDGVYEAVGSHVSIFDSGSTIGQLHWYANEIGVLGCTIENSNILSMKQVKPEKDVAMNVIISFLTKVN